MTQRVTTWAVLGVAVVAAASAGWAQYGYDSGYHASTVGEGYARGMADLVRGLGEANLYNSEAAKNYEDARAANFDNRLRYTEMYFQRKRINEEYTRDKYKRSSPEALARMAHSSAPKRLTRYDLDPVSGVVQWPRLLTQEAYAEYTAPLDKLFAERAYQGGEFSGDQFSEVQELCKQLLAALKNDIGEHPPMDYIQARRFVESLGHESRFSDVAVISH